MNQQLLKNALSCAVSIRITGQDPFGKKKLGRPFYKVEKNGRISVTSSGCLFDFLDVRSNQIKKNVITSATLFSPFVEGNLKNLHSETIIHVLIEENNQFEWLEAKFISFIAPEGIKENIEQVTGTLPNSQRPFESEWEIGWIVRWKEEPGFQRAEKDLFCQFALLEIITNKYEFKSSLNNGFGFIPGLWKIESLKKKGEKDETKRDRHMRIVLTTDEQHKIESNAVVSGGTLHICGGNIFGGVVPSAVLNSPMLVASANCARFLSKKQNENENFYSSRSLILADIRSLQPGLEGSPVFWSDQTQKFPQIVSLFGLLLPPLSVGKDIFPFELQWICGLDYILEHIFEKNPYLLPFLPPPKVLIPKELSLPISSSFQQESCIVSQEAHFIRESSENGVVLIQIGGSVPLHQDQQQQQNFSSSSYEFSSQSFSWASGILLAAEEYKNTINNNNKFPSSVTIDSQTANSIFVLTVSHLFRPYLRGNNWKNFDFSKIFEETKNYFSTEEDPLSLAAIPTTAPIYVRINLTTRTKKNSEEKNEKNENNFLPSCFEEERCGCWVRAELLSLTGVAEQKKQQQQQQRQQQSNQMKINKNENEKFKTSSSGHHVDAALLRLIFPASLWSTKEGQLLTPQKDHFVTPFFLSENQPPFMKFPLSNNSISRENQNFTYEEMVPPIGTPVTAAGFPLFPPNLKTKKKEIHKSQEIEHVPLLTRGRISKWVSYPFHNTKENIPLQPVLLISSALVLTGNSGGPLLTSFVKNNENVFVQATAMICCNTRAVQLPVETTTKKKLFFSQNKEESTTTKAIEPKQQQEDSFNVREYSQQQGQLLPHINFSLPLIPFQNTTEQQNLNTKNDFSSSSPAAVFLETALVLSSSKTKNNLFKKLSTLQKLRSFCVEGGVEEIKSWWQLQLPTTTTTTIQTEKKNSFPENPELTKKEQEKESKMKAVLEHHKKVVEEFSKKSKL